MNAQAIHVRTKASAQTERTDSTAAARQDLVEHNVKQVTVSGVLHVHYARTNPIYFSSDFVRFCGNSVVSTQTIMLIKNMENN